MKKIITIFILFTAFIACCFAAVSCKSSRAVGGHKHELVTVKAKAVTCTEEGWNEYVYCITEGCGYTTKNVKKALGHNMNKFPKNPLRAPKTDIRHTEDVRARVAVIRSKSR